MRILNALNVVAQTLSIPTLADERREDYETWDEEKKTYIFSRTL
jgi:hypothetical protein